MFNLGILILSLIMQTILILQDTQLIFEYGGHRIKNDFVRYLLMVAGVCVDNLIVVVQKYEWACMLHIIFFQQGRTLGEITFRFSEPKEI